MDRFIIRMAAALTAAFVIFPCLFVLMFEPSSLGEFLGAAFLMFFVQFVLPGPLCLIPAVLGAFAGIVWHSAAEMLRHEDQL